MTDLDELERRAGLLELCIDRIASYLNDDDDDVVWAATEIANEARKHLYRDDLATALRELRAYRTVTADKPYLQDRVRREVENGDPH